MKIGFFTDTYLPAMHGVTTSIRDFGEELVNRGHEIHLYAPDVDREYDRGMKIHSCRSITFKPYPSMRSAMALQMEIPELDLIHAQNQVGMGWYALKIAEKKGLPRIATYHTALEEYSKYITPFYPKLGWWIIFLYTRYFFNKFDRVICPTRAMAQKIKEVKTPKVVLPSGVNLKIFKEVKNAKQKLDLDGPVYLTLSRLGYEKRIEDIIKASKMLDFDHTLIIGGKGPDEKRLHKLAGEDKNIKFAGYIPEEEINTYYSAADFFLLASDTETQGLTPLEAMACKTPAIASDASPNPEQVYNEINGFLFKNRDPQELAQLLKTKKPSQKLKRGAYETAEKFSVPKCTDRLEKLYEEVIEEHKKKN